MLPAPIEHRFLLENEPYVLVEWTRGGEKRIRMDYAMAIAPSPTVLDNIDGQDLYAEAIARECLKEAPALFWEELPAQAQANGTPRRVISLERVPRALWSQFRQEVVAFLGKIFPVPQPDDAGIFEPRPAESLLVATAEAVPARPRMRAE